MLHWNSLFAWAIAFYLYLKLGGRQLRVGIPGQFLLVFPSLLLDDAGVPWAHEGHSATIGTLLDTSAGEIQVRTDEFPQQ